MVTMADFPFPGLCCTLKERWCGFYTASLSTLAVSMLLIMHMVSFPKILDKLIPRQLQLTSVFHFASRAAAPNCVKPVLCTPGDCGEGLRVSNSGHWQEEVPGALRHHGGPVHVDHQETHPAPFRESHLPLCWQNCPPVQVRAAPPHLKLNTGHFLRPVSKKKCINDAMQCAAGLPSYGHGNDQITSVKSVWHKRKLYPAVPNLFGTLDPFNVRVFSGTGR